MVTDNKTSSIKKSRFAKDELNLMHRMFEDAPVVMGILEGPDHRVQYVNQHMREISGNRPIPPGTPAREIWPEVEEEHQEGESLFDLLDQVYHTGEAFIENEFKVFIDRTYTGVLEKGYFNFIYQPLEDSEGERYGIFVSGYEVTDQVKASREKVRHEQQLKFAFEGGRIGYWEFDVKNEIFNYVSDLCKIHFGRSQDETFTNDDFVEAVHPDDASCVKAEIRKSIHELGLYEVEYRIIWPDGSLHWLMSRWHTLRDKQNNPSRLSGITMDITRQKETEQKLKEAVRIRDDFLSIAAHELQTPVTSLKARTELFERLLKDAGKRKFARQARKINERIDQLSRLTGSLLDISRLQEGKLKLEREVFPLHTLIEETVETINHISNHEIEVQGETRKTVFGDRYRIGQVLTNLLENAVKYSPDADKVILRFSHEGGNMIVSVTDFGIGISEDEKEKIFERFFKGGGEKRETYPGFGIGLYISAQIVRRHGGTIWVDNNEDQGCVFCFTLPAADNEQT